MQWTGCSLCFDASKLGKNDGIAKTSIIFFRYVFNEQQMEK